TRLAVAPANIVAIGAGKAVVVATEAGAFRLERSRLVALPALPAHLQLVSDRWALVDRGALDLASGKLTAWPGELPIHVAPAARGRRSARPPGGPGPAARRRGRPARDPPGPPGPGGGAAVARAGRAAVALDDGRIALRDPAGWRITEVSDEPAADHPGAAPAS